MGGSQRLPEDAPPAGEGFFWGRIPADRTRMVTTVSNPTGEALRLEVEVNGEAHTAEVPAGATVPIRTPLSGATDALGVTYRGDRRLVLLETRFDTSPTTP
jgi:hypothetical protein